jgi:diguanylate cyclase (GGDEF)-like protein/PAS domain S-box-containing protein
MQWIKLYTGISYYSKWRATYFMKELTGNDFTFLFIAITIVVSVFTTSLYERKYSRQSKKLLLNEQYYKSLFDQNPDVILTFDIKGVFQSANSAVSTLFGYKVKELINQSFAPFIVPDDLKWFLKHFNLAVKGQAHTYECRIYDRDAKQRNIRVTNIPIYANGKVDGVYAILKDISDHKKAQRNLVEAEARYRSIVENSQIGVYIYQNKSVIYVNPRLCEITGYESKELLGLKLRDYIVPEDVALVREDIQKLSRNEDISFIHPFRVNRKDGSIVTLEIHGSKIEYNDSTAIIGTIIDITERINSERIIKHMAYHDQLTDLPNRYLLQEKLDETIKASKENQKNFALLFLDLDRFKIVNDTIGHDMGDKLLIEITKKLKECTNLDAIISRHGGDEFVILLPDSNKVKAGDTARRIITHLATPFTLNHQEILITPSIGIGFYPEHGSDYDELIKNADLAMYHAKSLGKNNFQFYTDDLKKHSKYEIELERNLRKALERDEFVLYYQPQMNLETNQIIGAEALIRWNHPKKGIVSPAEFIPAAEESGLIIPIGEWALRTACYQNKRWQELGLPSITVSVNISAKQFFQSNLVELVQKTLEETGIESKYLELEITESMTMDVERSIATLVGLKKIGVKISIDDFGTGYSSLNYLKQFPIDKLKVDQSFIRDSITDPHDETIVKTIIAMAHNLHLKVIAEGVETKEHISFLLQQMCTEAQGYYFSKPIPVNEFENKYIIENKLMI